ncbi:1,4-alpha-glucan branching enzyme GlgB [Paenibacillus allorhizoplanae]|uniref:1,4-alpha-glucan branching enzyme GlgB n=1 Tax=Paenibacillus allorhizoplanae TaxID=2905648 RepID=A0ABM9C1H2_9BACL|nr:alpha-amylase family glycosyl hydrolase [Paenibacillus allorhizoplanae]CAH1199886.1 1,4-alpha-glucan branching enzyme GlgB [Paenibacillus allorhizoplanae]
MSHFPTKGSQGVRFTFATDSQIESVAVAGTFNNWNGDRNFMRQIEGENVWELELPIPKGRHLYKFVVNGDNWILDPMNPSVSEDGQNNSAITVTEHGDVLIRTNDISEEQPGYMYDNYKALSSPEWIKKAVIYELHIRAFTTYGFNGLADHITYFKKLGVNTLWLMPFNEVGLEGRIGKYGDPYAVKDFYRIDPSFGTEEELAAFIRLAHENGMRVILDWVLNRTSVDHIMTTSNPDFFTRTEQNELYYDVPNRSYFAGLQFDNRDMRSYVIEAMKYWVVAFDFDGIRLDDSDITPYDFLTEIKQALQVVKEDLILISQSYDEYHHLESCDLTYDGKLRILIRDWIDRKITQQEFMSIYNSFKYSFPQHALRMSWLEEKEQSRIASYLGEKLAGPAATILLTLEGVPCLMMGQEFNEPTLATWASLFDEYHLNWQQFDSEMFEHYAFLIQLRTSNPAFWKGKLTFIRNTGDMVLSVARQYESDTYMIVVNLSPDAVVVRFDDSQLDELDIHDWQNVIYRTGTGKHQFADDSSELWLDGYESVIFRKVNV